jgi:EmrB/QacA subfamily drug resistance transporter
MTRSGTEPSGTPTAVRLASPAGRWTVAAAVLSSGAVFVESTVVTVALPVLGRDLRMGLDGLQWVVNSYLLTLSALMLIGGSLGDLYGHRRVLLAGLAGFTLASALAALAPSAPVLLGVRLAQGAAGAILVPNTLALLNATIDPADRGAAIGRWSAWSAVSTALGPLVGGWTVDALSWRWVFAVPVPFGLLALWITATKVPAAPVPPARSRHLDLRGAALVTLGLGALTWALIAAPHRPGPLVPVAALAGALLLVAFLVHERRAREPMLPLAMFRSSQFSGANAVTLLDYAALGGLFFLLTLELQDGLGYPALAAGAALLPINVLMLALSPAAGRLGQRYGPRWPIAAGSLVAALGMLLLARAQPGVSYVGVVLPGVIVFGLGLAVLVAPLTTAVLGAVDEGQGGIASAVNNAAARVAGLLATATLPLAAGFGGPSDPAGYARAMRIAAGLCLAGAVVAFVTIRRGGAVPGSAHPNLQHGSPDQRARTDRGIRRGVPPPARSG